MKMLGWWGLSLAIGAVNAQEWQSRPLSGFPLKRESAHFCLFWENPASLSLETADSALNALEGWWDFHVGQKRFPDAHADQSPRIRTSVFLLEQGWAQGGMDGGHPALWFSRAALRDPWALGHEFAQSLQSATGGFQGSPWTGWIWASHANWMTHQRMDTTAGCSELYRRQTQIHYGSTRNRFCNWPFLEYLEEHVGQGVLDSLWTRWPGKKAAKDQDFFGLLEEELSLGQGGLSDLWGDFALRMAGADFLKGAAYRKAWTQERSEEWARLDHVELDAVDTAKGRWSIPFEMAPQAMAFNSIPLHDLRDTVRIRFRGAVQASSPPWTPRLRIDPETIPPPASDWRWGVALVDTSSTSPRFRYVRPLTTGDGLAFAPAPTENAYLVVAATPHQRPMILWDQSYRSLYRYPWMVEVLGAKPEGWQSSRMRPPAVAGGRHAKGGGFVASTAKVDSSVWIGPRSMVLEEAQILENARVEDYAIVKGRAIVRGQAVVRERARVWGNADIGDKVTISGHAVVSQGLFRDSSRVEGFATARTWGTSLRGHARLGGTASTFGAAQLSGTAQVEGDAELWAVKAEAGIFSGLVDASCVKDPALGANMILALPEVTQAFPLVWQESPARIAGPANRPSLRILRHGNSVSISGISKDVRTVSLKAMNGRHIGSTAVSSAGIAEFPLEQRGLFLVILHGLDGLTSTRMVSP